MTRTSAYGGSDRVIPLPTAPHKTSSGGGVAVDRHNKPWPFDPCEPKPRPQTWRNRRRIALRYVMEHRSRAWRWLVSKASLAATAAAAYWLGTVIGKVL